MRVKCLSMALSVSVASALWVLPMDQSRATGGHFMVEGTGIAQPGRCELEVWGQHRSRSRVDQVLAAQPACSTRNGWEFTVPIEYFSVDSQLKTFGLDVKTVLSTNLQGGRLAVSIGMLQDYQLSEYDSAYINLPYSFQLDDTVTLHLNGGTEYDNIDKAWNPTWGFATTINVNPQLDLIAESAGVIGEKPAAALGLRQEISSNIELDASFRRDFEIRSNIVSVGFNFFF